MLFYVFDLFFHVEPNAVRLYYDYRHTLLLFAYYILYSYHDTIGLATRWLRILLLSGIDKICNYLVAKPIF